MGGLNTSELPAYRFSIFWPKISFFIALFYIQTFHSIIMIILPRLPYDVINFEIDLMKDLGVKIEHGRWSSQLFDFFCLEELRVDCKSDLDHVNLVKLTINSNVYLYLSLSATYSTQIPWKRRPHYWADEKGLWSRYLFPSIYFSWCKKYSPNVRHQEDKAFAIVFFVYHFIRPKYTFHIQTIGPLAQ